MAHLFKLLVGGTDHSAKWKDLTPHSTPFIREQLVVIGSSIWYSTSYSAGESGMAEYDIKSNKIINIVKYPTYIQPLYHSLSAHDDKIYIIDGQNCRLILFDPSTKSFTTKLDIPHISAHTSCITIKNHIHIFNGVNNVKHLIYSPIHNTIITVNDPTTKFKTQMVCLLSYQDKIVKFGGHDTENQKMLQSFYLSSMIASDQFDKIKWDIIAEFRFKQAVCYCGYILFDHFIITFGGEPKWGTFTDAIYVLDLKGDKGWVKMQHIKCPMPSSYKAVLDGDKNVHLFTTNNKKSMRESVMKHYCIPVTEILGDMYVNIGGKDDEEDNKSAECDGLKERLLVSEKERIKLQGLVDKLTRENNEYKKNEILLKKQNNELSEECKEMKMELMEIKQELNKMKRLRAINIKNYLNWNADEVVDWISTLDDGKYEQYDVGLRLIFNKEGVDGQAIVHIDKLSLRDWGVNDFKDRSNIYNHCQKLINQQELINKQEIRNNNDENEGAGTVFIG